MALKTAFPLPTPPKALLENLFRTFDIEVDALIEAPKARSSFDVSGRGLSVAVLDTGLRVTHRCFHRRVLEPKNFTKDDGGNPDVVTDKNGHGTNVAGIIAAGTSDERRGIAPNAKVVPLKVLPAKDMSPILSALQWVHDNAERLKISVANLSLGAPGINLTTDYQAAIEFPTLSKLLDSLVKKNVAVVVAAGNSYFGFQTEGMSIPAIFRQVISVGAVYDASFGSRKYADGAIAFSTHADQITPFSQRLSKQTNSGCYTDVFAPGGAATSAGAHSDNGISVQDGTSQAAPTVAGIVLLLQEYYLRLRGVLPSISILKDILRSSSTWVMDGDDEDDNVKNSEQKYPRVNALQSLIALHKAIQLGIA